jgi:hypothetical protein
MKKNLLLLCLGFLLIGSTAMAAPKKAAVEKDAPYVELEFEIRTVGKEKIRGKMRDGSAITLRRSAIEKPLSDGKIKKHEISLEEWAHVSFAAK